MASKRKTGPGQAKLKRKRRRRYQRWNWSFARVAAKVRKALGPNYQKVLDQMWTDALFPRLLYRPPTFEVEDAEQPGDAEAHIFRFKIRTNDPYIAAAMQEAQPDDGEDNL